MEPIKTTYITGIWSYLETIEWSDPWFSALLVFHLTTLLVTFITRNKPMLQAVFFVLLLISVYLAESLNKWAAEHWRLFTRQQYFDSNGLFISLVWSVPLLVNCLLIVMMWILTSSRLMVSTGQLKLAHKRKAQAERDKVKEKNQ